MNDDRGSLSFRFFDGVLEAASGNQGIRIRLWPEPSARSSENGKDWKEFRPCFRVIYPQSAFADKTEFHGEQERQAWLALPQSIPLEVANTLERFESYRSAQAAAGHPLG